MQGTLRSPHLEILTLPLKHLVVLTPCLRAIDAAEARVAFTIHRFSLAVAPIRFRTIAPWLKSNRTDQQVVMD